MNLLWIKDWEKNSHQFFLSLEKDITHPRNVVWRIELLPTTAGRLEILEFSGICGISTNCSLHKFDTDLSQYVQDPVNNPIM